MRNILQRPILCQIAYLIQMTVVPPLVFRTDSLDIKFHKNQQSVVIPIFMAYSYLR